MSAHADRLPVKGHRGGLAQYGHTVRVTYDHFHRVGTSLYLRVHSLSLPVCSVYAAGRRAIAEMVLSTDI